ncbi:unnamed protein product, partial [Mesorhabditis spiculigera]
MLLQPPHNPETASMRNRAMTPGQVVSGILQSGFWRFGELTTGQFALTKHDPVNAWNLEFVGEDCVKQN